MPSAPSSLVSKFLWLRVWYHSTYQPTLRQTFLGPISALDEGTPSEFPRSPSYYKRALLYRVSPWPGKPSPTYNKGRRVPSSNERPIRGGLDKASDSLCNNHHRPTAGSYSVSPHRPRALKANNSRGTFRNLEQEMYPSSSRRKATSFRHLPFEFCQSTIYHKRQKLVVVQVAGFARQLKNG